MGANVAPIATPTSHLAHPDYHHKKYRLLHLRLFVCTHLITHSKKAGCRPIDLVKSNLDLDCSSIVIGSLNNRIKLKLRIIVVVSQRIRDRAIKRPRINIGTPAKVSRSAQQENTGSRHSAPRRPSPIPATSVGRLGFCARIFPSRCTPRGGSSLASTTLLPRK